MRDNTFKSVINMYAQPSSQDGNVLTPLGFTHNVESLQNVFSPRERSGMLNPGSDSECVGDEDVRSAYRNSELPNISYSDEGDSFNYVR